MKTVVHKADSRGLAQHGWLTSRHTFSFANYYEPSRINFGLLRVLNDDVVAGGKGFGMHPHNNMEIISIPLHGALEHRDSMGNTYVIRKGDVQVMSAGSGVTHSEYNQSASEPVQFLQIWIYPKERNIAPRYEQKNFDVLERKNTLQTVIAPDGSDGAISINQDAWLSLSTVDSGNSIDYVLHRPGNIVYVFVLEGTVDIAGEHLERRDAIGIEDAGQFSVGSSKDAEILFIEVPAE
jgi:redox-sensitive bicupin YhaK (pirin superfamily)